MGRKQKTETEEELPIDDTVLRVPPKRPQSIITTIMQILLSHPPSSTTDSSTTTTTKTTLAIILFTSFFSLILIFSLSFFSTSTPSPSTLPDPYLFPTRRPGFTLIPSDPDPPSIAYLISGSKGDSARILRILYATYHPKNFYLLHLDLSAHQKERDGLALTVQSVPVFQAAQNVYVIGKADFAYPKGSSPISATLHGAAVLLRLAKNWDWFVSLGATDYPLVTQDDLLHILSYMPKDVNFIHHSSYIGWRESKKLKPIIVDPGLYIAEKTEMFYASQKRKLPSSFQIFTGSSFSILSRSFIEHCILGTDNLPRILMMYFSNTPYSLTNYFQTILCNSHRFNRTVINNNLQFVPFEKPTRSRQLNSSEFHAMFHSGAAFATQLRSDDPALDRIDEEILGRTPGKVVPGGWCLGDSNNGTCSFWGDADILRPGPAAARLETLLVKLLANGEFRSHQCVVES